MAERPADSIPMIFARRRRRGDRDPPRNTIVDRRLDPTMTSNEFDTPFYREDVAIC